MSHQSGNRAARRARDRVVQRARVKALRERNGHNIIRNEVLMLDVVSDEEIRVRGLDLLVGEPLSVVWTPNGETEEDGGYSVLDAEPSAAMVLGRKLVAGLSEEWTLLDPVQVWAKWRPRDSALVLSHSMGALVYALHPIVWSDQPDRGTDGRLMLAILTEKLGLEHRAPADVPGPVSQTSTL